MPTKDKLTQKKITKQDNYELNPNEIGARCKSLREKAHLTQEELAAHWGYSRVNVSNLEKGKVITLDALNFYRNFFNVSVDYLLYGIVIKSDVKAHILIRPLINDF